MKKLILNVSVIALFLFNFTGDSKAKDASLGAPGDPMDNRYQQVSEEADRNRELLEIWKEHVRTLTQERDEAYRQIEDLKVATPPRVQPPAPQAAAPAQFGGVEIQPLPSQEALRTIEGLRSQVSALEGRLAEQSQMISAQPRPAAPEISREEVDALVREREAADRRVRELEERLRGISSDTSVSREKDQLMEQVKSLRAQVDSLQYENEKAQIVERELRENTLAKKSLTKEKEDLLRQIGELQARNESFKTDAGRLRSLEQALADSTGQKSRLEQANTTLQESHKMLQDRVKAISDERDEAQRMVQDLEVRSRGQIEKLGADNESLRRSQASAENNLRIQERKLTESYSRIAELEKVNEQIRAEKAGDLKTIENLRANLQADLSDIKNLKMNFESYLEALVSSFDERGKKLSETVS